MKTSGTWISSGCAGSPNARSISTNQNASDSTAAAAMIGWAFERTSAELMRREPYVQVRRSGQHDPQHARERAALEPVRRVAGRVPAGLVDHAELGRGRPGPRELAVVGVPLARGVAHPAHAPSPASRIRCSTFSRGRDAVECRSKRLPRPTSSSESASRTSFSRSVRSRRRDERGRPEVVGRARVRPLLGAGRDQPHVAGRRRLGGQRAGERDERPDAGRVVVGAGRGRDAVGVRHRDHQAVARRVPDPDHVARRALARHAEALIADAQPDRPEARRDPLVRAPLGRRRRRPRPLPRQRDREVVAPPRRTARSPRARTARENVASRHEREGTLTYRT